MIKDLQWKFNYQLNASNKFQYLFQSDNKYRNARGATCDDAEGSDRRSRRSDKPLGPAAADALASPTPGSRPTSWCSTTSSPTCTAGSSWTTRTCRRRAAARRAATSRRDRPAAYQTGRAPRRQLPLEHPAAQQPHDRRSASRSAAAAPTRRCGTRTELKTDGTYFLTHFARRRPQPEVRPRLPQEPDPVVLALQRRRARRACSAWATRLDQLRRRRRGGRRLRPKASCPTARSSIATSCATTTGGPTTATSRTATATASCA